MFTWSFGCAPSPARVAMTSLGFMFDEVPEPVWKTSIGNCSSCSPSATASPAAAIRSARSWSSRPSSALTRAAAALMRPSHRITGSGTRSPDTGKFSTALRVSAPQSSEEVTVIRSQYAAGAPLLDEQVGALGDHDVPCAPQDLARLGELQGAALPAV